MNYNSEWSLFYICTFMWWLLNQTYMINCAHLCPIFFFFWHDVFLSLFFFHRISFFFCGHIIRIYLNILATFQCNAWWYIYIFVSFLCELLGNFSQKLTICNITSHKAIFSTHKVLHMNNLIKCLIGNSKKM